MKRTPLKRSTKPIKKKSPAKIPTLRRKAEKLWQQAFKALHPDETCMLCNKKYYEVVHHFISQSSSANLKFDFTNGIPLCTDCHCRLHLGETGCESTRIAKQKSGTWWDYIEEAKRTKITMRKSDFLETIERLERIIKNCADVKIIGKYIEVKDEKTR